MFPAQTINLKKIKNKNRIWALNNDKKQGRICLMPNIIYAHTPATLDSSRSSSSASWCNASADSWGAEGKQRRMMLMLSKLPCGVKQFQQRWVTIADFTNVNTWHMTSSSVNCFRNRSFLPGGFAHQCYTIAEEQENVNGMWKKLWHFEVIVQIQAGFLVHYRVTWWTNRVQMWPLFILIWFFD